MDTKTEDLEKLGPEKKIDILLFGKYPKYSFFQGVPSKKSKIAGWKYLIFNRKPPVFKGRFF